MLLGGFHIFFIVPNLLIVSLLLWLVSSVGYLTNKNNPNKHTYSQYECGFKTTTSFKINVFINSILSLFFILIYEIEFTLLTPFIFNIQCIANLNSLFVVIVFLIIGSFFLDNKISSIEWRY